MVEYFLVAVEWLLTKVYFSQTLRKPLSYLNINMIHSEQTSREHDFPFMQILNLTCTIKETR